MMMAGGMRQDRANYRAAGRMLGARPPLPPLKYENLADEEIKDDVEVEE